MCNYLSAVDCSFMLKAVPSGKTYRQYLTGKCIGTVLHSSNKDVPDGAS